MPASQASAWNDNTLRATFDDAPLALASKRTYKATLNMLAKCHELAKAEGLAAGQVAPATLSEWMRRPSAAWACIQKAYPAVRTQQQAVKCILALYKYGLDCSKDCLVSQQHSNACTAVSATAHAEWHTILRNLDHQVRAQVSSSELSAREEQGWVELSAVQAAEERLRTEYGSPRHLLLSFAALTEPVRGGDLGRVRVCIARAPPATGNYIEIPAPGTEGKATLVLRDHKTAHAARVGTLVRVLPQQLAAVVRASLEAAPRDWLFEAPRGGPFTEEAHFTAWANRVYKAVFGKPVTANILRHAFISAIDLNRTSTAALEATAARFGHSLATQIAYRRLSTSKKRKSESEEDGELLVALKTSRDDTSSGDAGAIAAPKAQELTAGDLGWVHRHDEPRRVTRSTTAAARNAAKGRR